MIFFLLHLTAYFSRMIVSHFSLFKGVGWGLYYTWLLTFLLLIVIYFWAVFDKQVFLSWLGFNGTMTTYYLPDKMYFSVPLMAVLLVIDFYLGTVLGSHINLKFMDKTKTENQI